MAMSGIRDMSTLEEPPEDRLPVQTFVMEHDWNIIADAIRRELQRGGQVHAGRGLADAALLVYDCNNFGHGSAHSLSVSVVIII